MEEKIYQTWQREGYRIEEKGLNYRLHKFEVISDEDNRLISTIYPSSQKDMNAIIESLYCGMGVNGWHNGRGEVIEI